MTTVTEIKSAFKGNFRISRLVESIAIGEAIGGDRYAWGNSTETEPPFLVYLGCPQEQVSGYIETLNTFYRCSWCSVRRPKHLKDFEAEIKIRRMQRYSNSNALGLDYLLESESAKNFGADLDEYQYYSTGYMPRW